MTTTSTFPNNPIHPDLSLPSSLSHHTIIPTNPIPQFTQLPIHFNPLPHYTTNDINDDLQPTPDQHKARNLKENIPLGDTITTKQPNAIRFYFQNIRGAKKKNTWHDWENSVNYLHDHEVDIMGYAETNLAWNDLHQRTAIHRTMHKYTKCKLSTSNSIDLPLYSYQPGGTSTIITNTFVGHVTTPITDTTGLGRWSGFRLRKKNKKHLSIITAYCPHKDYNHGSDTCYQQQYRILRNTHNNNPEPRHTMIYDLKQLIYKLQEQHDDIILMWDANNELESDELEEVISDLNMFNLLPQTYPTFSTYLRGARVIDHIWGTSDISQYVIQHGYTGFHDNAWTTDHRGLYVDLNTNLLFEQGNPTTMIPPTPRLLQATNKSHILLFLEAIQKTNSTDKLLQLSQQLLKLPTWTNTNCDQLNKLDVDFTALLLDAEQVLKKKRQSSWSPDLHNAFLIHTYWRKHNSCLINGYDLPESLLTLQRQLQPKVFFGSIRRHPQQQLRYAANYYRQCLIDADNLRDHHLTLRQELMIEAGSMEKANAIRSIRNIERKLRMYKTIRRLNHPESMNGGLSYVIDIDSNGNEVRIDNIDEMNKRLYDRNRLHFSQAHGTPCTTASIIDILGENGTTDAAQRILLGDIPDDLPKPLEYLFQAMKSTTPMLDSHYALDDMIQGFSKWRENTTTSPSGKHLGIYKALTNAHLFQLRTDDELKNQPINTNSTIISTPSLATTLLQIQNNILNLAIKHEHVLERWKLVHNFFIEKIPGKPLLTKLRVIHIYEADYNILLKFFISKQTLRHAIKHNNTSVEQAGGRPNRTAIDEALRTVVTYETCRLQRLSGGVMYNDAKACFDRIIENMSNITCLQAGAPQSTF